MLKRILMLVVVAIGCVGVCFAKDLEGRSNTGTAFVVKGSRESKFSDDLVKKIEAQYGQDLQIYFVAVINLQGSEAFSWSPVTGDVWAETNRGVLKNVDIRKAMEKAGLPSWGVQTFGYNNVPVRESGFFAVAFPRDENSRVKKITIKTGIDSYVVCE